MSGLRRTRRVEPERVWVARSVLDEIFLSGKEWSPDETGGMLLGFTGVDPGELVITGAAAAGPNAVRSRGGFRPDGPWQREELARRYRESGRVTTYLGDWHSHVCGQAIPSKKDLRTAKKIARTSGARMPHPLTLIVACEDDRWLVAGYRYNRRRLKPIRLKAFGSTEPKAEHV